jgi:hypothetical protein
MLRGSAYGAKKFFGHAAAFDRDVVKRPYEAPSLRVVHSIAVTTANTAVHSSAFLSTPEINSVRSFRWRDANWGWIGGLLFSSLFWLAFFRFVPPIINLMLHFLYNRWAV